ncbi:MAG TPA: hypothetical protein V6C89_02970 [Drouetiella sp.]|jgi:hypothetical protein
MTPCVCEGSSVLLDSPDKAIARIAERLAQDGHHVPEDVVRRRFAAGLFNFEKAYKRLNPSGCVFFILEVNILSKCIFFVAVMADNLEWSN